MVERNLANSCTYPFFHSRPPVQCISTIMFTGKSNYLLKIPIRVANPLTGLNGHRYTKRQRQMICIPHSVTHSLH